MPKTRRAISLQQRRRSCCPASRWSATCSGCRKDQLNGREQTNFSGVAQLTVPLYEAGNIWSQSRQAIENVGKAQGTTDDARRAAVQTATQSWETINSAGASIRSLQTTINAAQIALEGVTQQQQVGQRTVQDVLIQQQIALHRAGQSRQGAARSGGGTVQPVAADRPAHRRRSEAAGEDLRRERPLQIGAQQGDRLQCR